MDGAKIGIISYGSTEPAIQEARHQLAEAGIKTDYLRVRAIPFTDEVAEFIHQHERNYVVEMNRDGQLRQILSIEFCDCISQLYSVAYTDGLPLTARLVREAIQAQEAK
jgi:2-oxoglutarate ferredoxin oxidoreductase subunit alpha